MEANMILINSSGRLIWWTLWNSDAGRCVHSGGTVSVLTVCLGSSVCLWIPVDLYKEVWAFTTAAFSFSVGSFWGIRNINSSYLLWCQLFWIKKRRCREQMKAKAAIQIPLGQRNSGNGWKKYNKAELKSRKLGEHLGLLKSKVCSCRNEETLIWQKSEKEIFILYSTFFCLKCEFIWFIFSLSHLTAVTSSVAPRVLHLAWTCWRKAPSVTAVCLLSIIPSGLEK